VAAEIAGAAEEASEAVIVDGEVDAVDGAGLEPPSDRPTKCTVR
jgi:hypothetical protein